MRRSNRNPLFLWAVQVNLTLRPVNILLIFILQHFQASVNFHFSRVIESFKVVTNKVGKFVNQEF